jgi:hypothetical protein
VRASRIAAVAVGLTLLLSGAGAGFAPAASAAPAAVAVAPAPATLIPKADFGGVAAVSAQLVWAVGSIGSRPLIERWNGATWQQVPTPSPATGGTLLAVTAASARSAWAAGESGGTPGKPSQALIEHWDGTSWRQVPSPHPGGASFLLSIAAVAARSAWAVGGVSQRNGTCPCTDLVERWNGSTWTRVASPDAAHANLSAVAAVSARSAWAVGDRHGQALIEHWNGTGWKRVPSPAPAHTSLSAVTALSARDAWAVGFHEGSPGHSGQAVIEHWNGTRWKHVPSPATPGFSSLRGVTAVSARDAWAVGAHNTSKALIEHWNGTRWKVVASPGSPRLQTLAGVAASSAKDAWAVGLGTGPGNSSLGLIRHWNGTAWS